MSRMEDTNAEVWKSQHVMDSWMAKARERERKRLPQWLFMSELLPFEELEDFTVLDLGAGTGAAARAILSQYPKSRAVLVDFTPQMVDEGARIMCPYEGRFKYVEFDLLTEVWPIAIPSRIDAVVTSQFVHHLPDERKQSLFSEIIDRLMPGGWYLNFDPITTEDPLVEAIWQRVNDRLDPRSAHERLHRTPQEQLQYENHVRYIIPLERQLEFLRSAGFKAVDVYWKQLDYVIYGGSRGRRV